MAKQGETMVACVFDGHRVRVQHVPVPHRAPGQVLVRVVMSGICNTDLEILRGYVPGFRGIPGHEFLGVVEEADDHTLIGRRVSAEINCACGTCDWCARGMGRHCPNRTVVGIVAHDGSFAEKVVVPSANIVEIPESITDLQAVFIEPLAAALEILDQVSITNADKVLVLGDGKLGLLVARALASTGCALTVVGRHRAKLALIRDLDALTLLESEFNDGMYDVVVEATGSSSALPKAIANARPRGTVVLKSTYSGDFPFNPSRAVVDEITIVGSRCGRFSTAIEFLLTHRPPLEAMVSSIFALTDAEQASARAAEPGAMKVLIANA